MNSLDFKINIDAPVALRTLQSMQRETQTAIVKLEALRNSSGGSGRSAELEALYTKLEQVNGQIHKMGLPERFKSEMLSLAESTPIVGNLMRALNGATGPVSAAVVGIGAAFGKTLPASSNAPSTFRPADLH